MGMTIDESIALFCKKTGHAPEQLRSIGPVRSAWARWCEEQEPLMEATQEEWAETCRLLAGAALAPVPLLLEGIKEEREACARLVEEFQWSWESAEMEEVQRKIAGAIRDRGN